MLQNYKQFSDESKNLSALLVMLFSASPFSVITESMWHLFWWTVEKVNGAIADALKPYTGAREWKCISPNLYSVQNDLPEHVTTPITQIPP